MEDELINVTVQLPAAEAGRIAAAYCARRGYMATSLDDAVNYVRTTILSDLYRETLVHEASLASLAAQQAVFSNPDDPLTSPPDQGI